MLEKIVETFLSNVLEKLADCAPGTVTTMNDYKVTLETLERNLRSLSAKACDVDEVVKNAELSGKKKRKREVENWLIEVMKLESEFAELEGEMESEAFIRRFLGGDRARKLSERVEGLLEHSRPFGELLIDVCECKGLPLLTRRLAGEKFEENFERIWDFLVIGEVRSIGIHGMGGVGKTTLVKHVHNRFLQRTQQLVVWITVSQTVNIKNLQDEIARAMDIDFSNEHDEDKRAARLNRALSLRMDVVLILNDVWKNINLEKIGDPVSLKNCRFIITTRSLEVCNQIGCQKVIQVKTLEKSEAWDLFKETLGGEITVTPQVREIAKCMAEKCGGLPLGIITTAGSMRGKSDVYEWSNALTELSESILREDDTEEMVFKILKYSFDRLDQGEMKCNGYTKTQHCFLYCCLYPEDYRIVRKELINLFDSEELLDKKRSRRKRIEQGHVVLNKSVNVCLLESEGKSWVKMHDLVRAMALKITKGKYMRVDEMHDSLDEILDEEEHGSKDLEKISLMRNDIEDVPVEWTPNYPKLSMLLFQHNCFLKFIPDSFFSKMHGLQVLDLSETGIEVLPDSLSSLRRLKALVLWNCLDLEFVPYLGDLKELRELDLSNTFITEVPQGMEKLANLECLKIDAEPLSNLPSNLLVNFPKLQCLHLPFHIEAPMNELGKLKQLEKLSGCVKDVHDFIRLMECQPSFKDYTPPYSVIVAEDYDETTVVPTYGDDDDDDDASTLMQIRDNEVIMCGINLKTDRRDANVLPCNVEHLTFRKCEGLSSCMFADLLRLNVNPMSLKTLKVEHCNGVECILKLEQFPMARGELEYTFQNLEVIELQGLPDLMGLRIFQRQREVLVTTLPPRRVFSSLKQLLICDCNNMKEVGLPVWELQNLEQIEVNRCAQTEKIIQEGKFRGGGSQAPIVVDLPKLKCLYLHQVPKLKSICNANVVCSSIRIIVLIGCTGLKKLPLVFGRPHYNSPPAAHERIWLLRSEQEWWESVELGHPSLHPLLQPFLAIS